MGEGYNSGCFDNRPQDFLRYSNLSRPLRSLGLAMSSSITSSTSFRPSSLATARSARTLCLHVKATAGEQVSLSVLQTHIRRRLYSKLSHERERWSERAPIWGGVTILSNLADIKEGHRGILDRWEFACTQRTLGGRVRRGSQGVR